MAQRAILRTIDISQINCLSRHEGSTEDVLKCTITFFSYSKKNMGCVYIYVCVCVCVCERERLSL